MRGRVLEQTPYAKEQTKREFFGVHTKKVYPPAWRTHKVPLNPLHFRNDFATQSEPQKSFVATSPHLKCCDKLKKFPSEFEST